MTARAGSVNVIEMAGKAFATLAFLMAACAGASAPSSSAATFACGVLQCRGDQICCAEVACTSTALDDTGCRAPWHEQRMCDLETNAPCGTEKCRDVPHPWSRANTMPMCASR